eukprot:TRINITY_DN12467_c0_g1_i2.p1 TRINITY_DN12467_c0_g1~~TRINITY_DN12467_c0_g1_i2.p1  ORF type:complete len:158 (-),score=44.49 TRINITY_DN12467_c0_g1_i2:281-754(-)
MAVRQMQRATFALGNHVRALCSQAPAVPVHYATGKRKASVARVWLDPNPAEKTVTVNGVSLEEFVGGLDFNRDEVLAPLLVTEMDTAVSVKGTVQGGGTTGQTGALRLGIARALVEMTPELRPVLRKEGFLTRDSRVVERKKPGQKKARKKFQWVKR